MATPARPASGGISTVMAYLLDKKVSCLVFGLASDFLPWRLNWRGLRVACWAELR